MYIKKVDEIVTTILEASKVGIITWSLKHSILNSELSKNYECKSEDGLTSFDIEIRITDQFLLEKGWSSMWIHNKNLPGGRFLAANNEYPNIDNIKNYVFKTYIEPGLVIKSQEEAFDGILSGISKQTLRDIKINKIIEEEKGSKE